MAPDTWPVMPPVAQVLTRFCSGLVSSESAAPSLRQDPGHRLWTLQHRTKCGWPELRPHPCSFALVSVIYLNLPWQVPHLPHGNEKNLTGLLWGFKYFSYCLVAKWFPTLLQSQECSPPGSSVQGIFPARILEWVAISFSRGSS